MDPNAPRGYLATFQALINMGYDEELSMIAAKKYPNEFHKAIDKVEKMQQNAKKLIQKRKNDLVLSSQPMPEYDESETKTIQIDTDKLPKLKPSWSHKVDTFTLKVGDHIYRRLRGLKAMVGYHHGVVIKVPDHAIYGDQKMWNQKVKVIEMTKKHGIRINTLEGFLCDWECRLVFYNTDEKYQKLHASGTCHIEPSSSMEEIQKRIDEIQEQIAKFKHKMYNLFGVNCEEFAVWIKTGRYKGARTQLTAWGQRGAGAVQTFSQTGQSLLQAGFNYADDAAILVVKSAKNLKVATSELGENTVTNGAKIGINGLKYSATGVALGAGLAVVVELGSTAYRLYKLKTDYKYTKSDFWRDTGRGAIVTGTATAVGIALMPIGWWAIIPVVAIAAGLNWALNYKDVFDKKTLKEKVYKDYKLTKKSNKGELVKVRRKLRRQIVAERLHPDHWIEDGSDNSLRLEKYLWLRQLMEWLNNDIQNGYVSFEEVDATQDQPPKAIELGCLNNV